MNEFIADSLSKLLSWKNSITGKIVLTNGVFDILHAGHVQYLIEAKKYADFLVVAINSDESVKKIKGDSRPIINQENRLLLLSQLKPVDKVIVFEHNPIEIMKQLVADYYVKANDYSIDTINQEERKVLEDVGSEIVFASFKENESSTNIIEKIKNNV